MPPFDEDDAFLILEGELTDESLEGGDDPFADDFLSDADITTAPEVDTVPPDGPPPGVEVLGFVGGVASGKSTLAAWLEKEKGWTRVDADAIAETTLRDAAVRDALRQALGDGVFRPDGTVERRALASASRRSPETAKAVGAYMERALRLKFILELHAAAAFRPPPGALILDAPTLLESGLDSLCTRLVFVEAKETVRLGRATRTRGWTKEAWAAREARLIPLETKRTRADVTVESGPDVTKAGAVLLAALGPLGK